MPFYESETTTPFVVALDFEGVLMDYDQRRLRCLCLALGRNEMTEQETYDLPESIEDAASRISRLDQWTVPVLAEYAIPLINELSRLGCDVRVITHVDPMAQGTRSLALSKLVEPECILCTGSDTSPESIVDLLLRMGVDAYLGGAWEYGYGKAECPGAAVAQRYATVGNAASALLEDSESDMDLFIDGVTTLCDAMDFPLFVWEKMRQTKLAYYYGYEPPV